MGIGTQIKLRRRELRISQKELAAQSGVSQQMISKLERGVAESTGDVVPLAIALGVRPEWLTTGRGPQQGNGVEPKPVDPRIARMVTKLIGLSPSRQELFLRLLEELQDR